MKTITEYRPLIFGEMVIRVEQRGERRKALRTNLLFALFYAAFGALLIIDTGLAPWNWQFWLVFGPAFVAGEMVVGKLRSARAVWLATSSNP